MVKLAPSQKFEDDSQRDDNRPDPIDVHVGQRMRLRRTMVGMSQEKLGEAVSLTFQQIQKYERGINRMGASRLYRLAQALGVNVAYFFEEIPSEIEQNNHKFSGLSERGQSPLLVDGEPADLLQQRETVKLLRYYYRITDPTLRQSIVDMMKKNARKQDDE
jgi:transcriptional regulator with XRE-family HTH domain